MFVRTVLATPGCKQLHACREPLSYSVVLAARLSCSGAAVIMQLVAIMFTVTIVIIIVVITIVGDVILASVAPECTQDVADCLMMCSKKGWFSSSSDSDSEDSSADYDSSGLPSFIEEPIRRLIQQQLEIYAADKTVRSMTVNLMTSP